MGDDNIISNNNILNDSSGFAISGSYNNVYNNTLNIITVDGYWKTDPYESGVIGGSGDVQSDQINVTFYRFWPSRESYYSK